MRRTLPAVLMCVAFQHATPDARQTADGARFDSASITVNASNGASGGCCRILPDGQVTASNVTVRQLIQSAYQRYIFDERPMSDLAGVGRFRSASTSRRRRPQRRRSMRMGLPHSSRRCSGTLLADRFKLRIRIEASERPIYALALARGRTELGPGLRRADVDCGAVMVKMIRGRGSHGLISEDSSQWRPDRPRACFDIDLEAVEIRPPGPFGPSYRPSDTQESIFSSLPEQLGLELRPASGPVEVLIVEHVEKPTEG